MLIEFSIKNFRSFKEKQVFSMLQDGKIKEKQEHLCRNERYHLSLLKTSVCFGANASGKSNFFLALRYVERLVLSSDEFKLDTDIPYYEPFLLDDESERLPVEFAIEFLAEDGFKYLYELAFGQRQIEHEALYFYPKGQKAKLFSRTKDAVITYGTTYFKGQKVKEVYENQLVLSYVGKVPMKPLIPAYRFFSKRLQCVSVGDNEELILHSAVAREMTSDSLFKKNLNQLLCAADTGISSLEVEEQELPPSGLSFPESFPPNMQRVFRDRFKFQVKTVHTKYRQEEKVAAVLFELQQESQGTKQLLAIGGVLIWALENGQTVFIDELDKSLHPLLTRMLIWLFHDKENNPKNAQLIFTTHDSSLIDKRLFRRDQVWFTEKDRYGQTELYPLSDFSGLSKIGSLNAWYEKGRFGGIPQISEFALQLEFQDESE